jgi:RNA polymerase sigma-70 factor (ECF subfamily)
MATDSTTQLQHLLNRINAGDQPARDELISRACERLRRLTRKVFQDFQRVRRFEDSADVLQNSVLRLMRRLRTVSVSSVADFFCLAAREIRLELLDLVRHYYGPAGTGTNLAPALRAPNDDGSELDHAMEGADSKYNPSELSFWTEFHAEVEKLPEKERAVFDLLWYHGMAQEEAAAVLTTSLSTLKRDWLAARLRLRPFFENETFSA